MSGLEIAGIVLGAVPVAITALEKYGEVERRLGLFNKIRREHKRCSDRLQFSHIVLKRHLRQLLLPLTTDDSLVEELLSNPGGKGWKDPAMVSRLQERLQGSNELYLDYIRGIERVMTDINQELALPPHAAQGQIHSEVSNMARLNMRIESYFVTGEKKRRPLENLIRDQRKSCLPAVQT